MNARNHLQSAVALIGLVSLAGALFIGFSPATSGLTLSLDDISARYSYFFSRGAPLARKVVAVSVDDYSLRMIKARWPWQRSLYARVIDTASAQGAEAVVFDLLFNGPSEDLQEDAALAAAIGSARCGVVLSYGIDVQKAELIMPPEEIAANARLGLLNSPLDPDERHRRLRAFVTTGNQPHYSLALQGAAFLLREEPAVIARRLPLSGDKTFLINYLVKPGDPRLMEVSFYDFLEQQRELEARFGKDYLRGALLLVFPRAEILHDTSVTPLGKMPGGYLHLNGILDIIEGKVPARDDLVALALCCVVLAVMAFVLGRFTVMIAAAFGLGLAVCVFWLQVAFRLNGIFFSAAPAVSAIALYLVLFFAWKYLFFFARLIEIKSKATLDPVREMFTARYFFYRLELEHDQLHMKGGLFLFLFHCEGLAAGLKDMDLAGQRRFWERVRERLAVKRSFWAAFSPENFAGALFLSDPGDAERQLAGLRSGLVAVFAETGAGCRVKAGCIRYKKELPLRELVYPFFEELKALERDTVMFSPVPGIAAKAYPSRQGEESGFLDGLAEDIEEKNRQLLSLVASLSKEYAKAREIFFEVISSLVNALEARDPYTQGHSLRVCNYSVAIARKLGWTNEEVEKIRKAAFLHDLGKIGIPDGVLHKKGKLTDEEFDFIKKHELISVKILEPIKELADILPWILHHHEKWNGKGYPHGLAGTAIPRASQIISLADVFDALATGRDYKLALSVEESLAEIEKGRGEHFDPELVDVFMALFRDPESKNSLLFGANVLK